MKEKKERCIICGKPIVGYGNNPWPLHKVGKCCDECNTNKVIPARLALIK